MRFLYSTTALLGAFLLFLVEPMFARMVLPLLGGAPAVWNTCLVFYQVTLLAGYLYAHAIRGRSARQQVIFQAVLLVAAAVALPIAVRGGGTPPPSANPIGWVFTILLFSIGLPFFVLATTGPLLQRWFVSIGDRSAGSPYSLFAASNVGSFVALLGYPFIVEPTLRLRIQSVGWSAMYAVYAACMLACGTLLWRSNPSMTVAPAAAAPPPAAAAPKRSRRGTVRTAEEAIDDEDIWATRMRWLGLSAVPSSLMMSVTTFISTDVASIPLLWVVPLALYLLTFVLAFAERQIIPRAVVSRMFPFAVVITIMLVIAPAVYPMTMIALHLSAFFIISLMCHQELAATRPPAAALTEFYLWLSGGGAIGGFFNALLAPLLFVNAFEYPLVVLSACLLLPNALMESDTREASPLRRAAEYAFIFVPLVMVFVFVTLVQRFDTSLSDDAMFRYAIIFGPSFLVAFAMRRTPLRMGIALAAVTFAGIFVRFDNRIPIHVERDFFGVHRVMTTGREHVLLSGTTNHGSQSMDPRLRCEPLTYYSRSGPIGQLFSYLKDEGKSRFGVVGLGTASMAAYASRGQTWTFFEINPVVERLARDPEYFTYLRDCAPEARVVTGDARLLLVQQPDTAFDALVLDAFSSDAIPVHLMTVEAMQLYFRKLAPGGILAVHVSNRYLDLAPVVAATAGRTDFVSILQFHVPDEAARRISGEMALSRWVLVARRMSDFGPLASDHRWVRLDPDSGTVWTDDYSNVLSAFHR